ncbi:MAG: ABC transporter ATP-binding protein [Polyangiaceae bacterium]|nr:ABC transporter ATP-binding protein [Polyangiaceae bacterium]
MINVSSVNKRFGSILALQDVSISIGQGERVAFVGTNGSGKTTLLRVILGLLPFDGTVTVGGFDVARSAHLALRHMAYIPQIAPPIDAPVKEVVRAQAHLRDNPVDATYACAKRLGLDLGASGSKRFRDLSGGMKQKLLAAMALASNAPILVCDEPTANLDGDARNAFFQELDRRSRDSIVILCSHRIDEVRQIVDRVLQLEEGRVVRDAPLADVLRSLKAFRVEILFRETSEQAHEALSARGFQLSGKNRYAARVAQHEKLALIKELLDEYHDLVLDVSVVPIEDFSLAISEQALRTDGVAS